MGSNLELQAAGTGGFLKAWLVTPSFASWCMAAIYLLSAGLCFVAGRAELRVQSRRDRQGPRPIHARPLSVVSPSFWWVAASALLLLGINRQLDLQNALTDFGRSLARAQNWYEGRQSFQRLFIAAIGLAGLSGSFAVSWSLRRAAARYHVALGGLFFLLSFVVIRAASFHNVDAFIGRRILGLKWNWILELGGIALIAVSATFCLRSSRSNQPPDRPDNHQGVLKYRIGGP